MSNVSVDQILDQVDAYFTTMGHLPDQVIVSLPLYVHLLRSMAHQSTPKFGYTELVFQTAFGSVKLSVEKENTDPNFFHVGSVEDWLAYLAHTILLEGK